MTPEKIRSRQLLDAVRGMPCTLRIASLAGVPCAGPDTVVPCHLPVGGKGIGTKVSDLAVSAGCRVCHDILDGRDKKNLDYIMEHYPAAVLDRALKGWNETLHLWIEKGMISVKGMK